MEVRPILPTLDGVNNNNGETNPDATTENYTIKEIVFMVITLQIG